MGVEAGDVDGSGRPSLFVTNFHNEPNVLFRNRGKLRFQDASCPSGLGPAEHPPPGVRHGRSSTPTWTAGSTSPSPTATSTATPRRSSARPSPRRRSCSWATAAAKFRDVVGAGRAATSAERRVGRGPGLGRLRQRRQARTWPSATTAARRRCCATRTADRQRLAPAGTGRRRQEEQPQRHRGAGRGRDRGGRRAGAVRQRRRQLPLGQRAGGCWWGWAARTGPSA